MLKIGHFGMLCVCLFLSACAPKIDASGSEETFYKSVEEVRLSLPQDKQEKFLQSIGFLMKQQVVSGTASLNSPVPLKLEQVDANVRNAVDGKTGQQIIEEAARYGLK